MTLQEAIPTELANAVTGLTRPDIYRYSDPSDYRERSLGSAALCTEVANNLSVEQAEAATPVAEAA